MDSNYRGKDAGLAQRLHNLEVEMEAVERRMKKVFFREEYECLSDRLFNLSQEYKSLRRKT